MKQLTFVPYQLGRLPPDSIPAALKAVANNLLSDEPQQNITIGYPFLSPKGSKPEQPQLENAYVKVLRQLFGEKLHVLNAKEDPESTLSGEISSAPEYLLGAYLARNEKRKQLLSKASSTAREGQLWDAELNGLMSRWITEKKKGKSLEEDLVIDIFSRLRQQKNRLSEKLLSDPWLFKEEVAWIEQEIEAVVNLGKTKTTVWLASSDKRENATENAFLERFAYKPELKKVMSHFENLGYKLQFGIKDRENIDLSDLNPRDNWFTYETILEISW